MKRIFYIGIAVFGLALASCSKQDIQPNSPDPVVPVWKSKNSNSEGGGPVVTEPVGTGTNSNNTDITDPSIDD